MDKEAKQFSKKGFHMCGSLTIYNHMPFIYFTQSQVAVRAVTPVVNVYK